MGIVWAVNLVFILDPNNAFFGTFAQTAQAFGPTTLGGPSLANFASGNALIFAWVVAIVTAYLAVAFLLGLTTRIACFVGAGFAVVLLVAQFGSTFIAPGGTDVGPQPLYLLIYVVLVAGGAGRSLSLDAMLAERLQARAARKPTEVPGGPIRHPWWTPSSTPRFLVTYFVVGMLLAIGVGAGVVLAIPHASASAPSTLGPTQYVNLTVVLNPSNGYPQFVPANFSVQPGRIVFTINDTDSPMYWSGCPCLVAGTEGNVELLNGSSVTSLATENVAHSFWIPALGVKAYSPGLSVIQFTVDVYQTGKLTWICVAPCGAGADPYTSPPMGVPGYMVGTMTVN